MSSTLRLGCVQISHHMKEPIEFTPREKFLINYYRDRQLSGGGRALVYHISYIVAPLLCAGLFFWNGESAWIFVGYALLLYRVIHNLWGDITYSANFSSIFEKYETRLKELELAQKGGSE